MKRRIRSAMVNLHIGGGISVFFICVSLLVCDHFFNRGTTTIQMSETDKNSLEGSSEFVSAPTRLFFFTHEPGNSSTKAAWSPRKSSPRASDSRGENSRLEELAPDGNFYSSGIQKN